ncbi:MAG TPA: hypothetical protein VGF26_01485 [Ramlibacter sp.]
MDTEIRQFFDRFVQAFARFDGELVASRYVAPYMATRADGSARVLCSPAEIAAYFQGVLDDYRNLGCTGCRYEALQSQALGADVAMATVTWFLDKEAGKVISSWRETYTLVRVEGHLKVRASVDHSG